MFPISTVIQGTPRCFSDLLLFAYLTPSRSVETIEWSFSPTVANTMSPLVENATLSQLFSIIQFSKCFFLVYFRAKIPSLHPGQSTGSIHI